VETHIVVQPGALVVDEQIGNGPHHVVGTGLELLLGEHGLESGQQLFEVAYHGAMLVGKEAMDGRICPQHGGEISLRHPVG
jgi:hypothetical protein